MTDQNNTKVKGTTVRPSVDICENGELRWNNADRGTEELGETPVPAPLCPPERTHGVTHSLLQSTC
jgi:hypothetical protein